jgi:sulfur carrier protein
MKVAVNGEEVDLPAGTTVTQLLARLRLPPVRVAVELNRAIVPRKNFSVATLHAGDRVEIVTFVGGG